VGSKIELSEVEEDVLWGDLVISMSSSPVRGDAEVVGCGSEEIVREERVGKVGAGIDGASKKGVGRGAAVLESVREECVAEEESQASSSSDVVDGSKVL
jgi:hypothetical protein